MGSEWNENICCSMLQTSIVLDMVRKIRDHLLIISIPLAPGEVSAYNRWPEKYLLSDYKIDFTLRNLHSLENNYQVIKYWVEALFTWTWLGLIVMVYVSVYHTFYVYAVLKHIKHFALTQNIRLFTSFERGPKPFLWVSSLDVGVPTTSFINKSLSVHLLIDFQFQLL